MTRRYDLDGNPVYLCPQCCDRGLIAVAHPRFVARLLANRGDRARDIDRALCGAAVLCTCDAGGKIADRDEKAKRAELARYNPETMYVLDGASHNFESWLEEQKAVPTTPRVTEYQTVTWHEVMS